MTAPGIEPLVDGGIVDALFDLLYEAREDRATAGGTRLRGSDSAGCLRYIALNDLGAEPDFAVDGRSLAAFEVGTQWHEVIQRALVALYGADLEVKVDLTPLGYDCSAHADAVYDLSDEEFGYDGVRRVVEIKSKSEFAYKKFALGTTKPFPQQKDIGEKPIGPEAKDLIQAGKSAIGVGADEVHMLYVNKNKTDELAEWIIDIRQPIPYLDDATVEELAVADLVLQQQTLDDVDRGLLPARFIPEPDPRNHKKGWSGGIVNEPPLHKQVAGKWGTPWLCSGCPFNLSCRRLPPDMIPLEQTGLRLRERTTT